MEPDRNATSAIEFFQQVRLLERTLWAATSADADFGSCPEAAAIGQWGDFADEAIHFRAANSVTHPRSPVEAVRPRSADAAIPAWTMDITFMGLVGPMGVLPAYVTALLLGKGEAARPALRDFLALFEHRFISRFYRAWELARPLFGLERSVRQDNDDATHGYSLAIRSLTGLGEPGLSQRLSLSPRLPAFYSGVFSNMVRPGECLSQVVTAAFLIPCNLIEFVAEWQTIAPPQRTSLLGRTGVEFAHDPTNARLGHTACVGSRVWTVQDRYRVRLGPLDYATFGRFTPAGDLFPKLCQLVRLFAGMEMAFDIQPVLLAEQVPQSQLRAAPESTTRLGWNSWLISRPPDQPAADAIFSGAA